MSVLSEIEIRKIKDATIREVIDRLTRNAQDPARIGSRALAWRFHLNRTEDRIINFAKRMGYSKARASVAASEAQAAIFDIRNVNPSSNGNNIG